MKAELHSDMYKHFLLLHVSVSILLNSHTEIRPHYLSYVRDLLNCFVENAATFYGENFEICNIYSLVHLSLDVENQYFDFEANFFLRFSISIKFSIMINNKIENNNKKEVEGGEC